jgi:outer membrane lipoprotein-sorting protein
MAGWGVFGQVGFVAVKDTAAMRHKLTEVSKSTNSIKCNFVQDKNLAMLSEKLTSRGQFYFKQKDLVRLEYTAPFKYLLIMNNGKATIKDEAKTTQMDMHRNKIFRQVNSIIVDCVHGSAVSSPDFRVEMMENKAQIRLDMKPLSKGMKEFFKNISVYIDKADYTVARMVMEEQSGDNTIINFTNKQINGQIADALFAVAR